MLNSNDGSKFGADAIMLYVIEVGVRSVYCMLVIVGGSVYIDICLVLLGILLAFFAIKFIPYCLPAYKFCLNTYNSDPFHSISE
jgi:hypothetical protein